VAFGLILFWILTFGLVFCLILVSNNLDNEQTTGQQSSRNTSHCEGAFLEKNHRRAFLSILFFLECLNSFKKILELDFRQIDASKVVYHNIKNFGNSDDGDFMMVTESLSCLLFSLCWRFS